MPSETLEGWQEIAKYLRCSVTTTQNWERRLGLPVHREKNGTRIRVWAYTGEIDDWVDRRNRGFPPPVEVDQDSFEKELIADLRAGLNQLEQRPIFRQIIIAEVRKLNQQIASMVTKRQYDKWARIPNDALLDDFIEYLSALDNGDSYDTISTFDFWSKNLGHPFDYLIANRRAARKGVRIRRVFLLPAKVPELPSEQRQLLQDHLRATAESDGTIQTKIYVSKRYDADLNNYGNFAIWSSRSHPTEIFLLNMIYERYNHDNEFKKIELICDKQIVARYQARFDELFTFSGSENLAPKHFQDEEDYRGERLQ